MYMSSHIQEPGNLLKFKQGCPGSKLNARPQSIASNCCLHFHLFKVSDHGYGLGTDFQASHLMTNIG